MKDVQNFLARHFEADQFSHTTHDRNEHSRDKSFHEASLPQFVVWPKSTQQVSDLLTFAHENNLPVTPWGKGTSLEGNPIPLKHGIVLDMSHMNQVLEMSEEDFQIRVQPGIIGTELNDYLRPYNFFFPAMPSSAYMASLGGMISNNSAGMFALKYGVVGDSVMELEVVLANGDVIHTGSKSVKNVAGYDLNRLFIGSEGTLGVITELTLKVCPLPEAKLALLISFNNIYEALGTVHDILHATEPAACELMDEKYIALVNKAKDLKLPETPTVIIEFHGTTEVVRELAERAEKIADTVGCIKTHRAPSPLEQNEIWEIRNAVRPVIEKVLPGQRILLGDIGVPLSKMSHLVEKAHSLAFIYEVEVVTFGHAGQGNFQVWAIYNPDHKESYQKAVKLNEELVEYAISIGGTSTGEHGIGIGKKKFLPKQYPKTLPLMRSIKDLLDPKHILNPGKIFE